MKLGRPNRLAFACPDCGGESSIFFSKNKPHGLFRYRRCRDCDVRFSTLDSGPGEQFHGYPGSNGPAAKKRQLAAECDDLRQRIMDLWLSVRVKAIWAKANCTNGKPVIITRAAGYDLNGDDKHYFDE